MTVLGRGDLSPPRRHRRRTPVVAVVVVLAVAAGVWWGWRTWHHSDPTAGPPVHVCVTPTAPPTPAAPADVTVSVLNTTDTVGLAHKVAAELRARGFRIGKIGNVKATVAGTALIVYPTADPGAARAVAEQVPQATLETGLVSTVTLELGAGFHELAPAADAAAARTRDLQAASPRPAVCTSS